MIDKTPTQEVLLMNRVSFTGNIIPHSWYQKLKFSSGKANLPAIIILAEICYWYRPVEVRDETTGELLRLEKKFFADKLQRKYESFESLGLTKKQAYDACHYLEEVGLITLETRTIKTKTGLKIPNVLFIGIDPRAISNLNQPLKEGESALLGSNDALPESKDALPTSNGTLPTSNDGLPASDTCTESSKEITKETSSSIAIVEQSPLATARAEILKSIPLTDLSTLTSKEQVMGALVRLAESCKPAVDLAKQISKEQIKDVVINCNKRHKECTCPHPLEIPQVKYLNESINLIASGAVNWKKEGEWANKIVVGLRKARYGLDSVLFCLAWAYYKDKFKKLPSSLSTVKDLMPEFLDLDRTGKLRESLLNLPKYETSAQRNERITRERNKEEIIKNAATVDEKRAKVFGNIH